MLAMGDALTMALVKKRRFRHGDFARLHPGGKLGKMLTLTVKSAMRRGATHAVVRPEDPMRHVLPRITSARAGSATVVDRRGRLAGIFTDGDLRRQIGEIGRDLSQPVKRFMTRRPLAVREDELAVDALQVFKRRQVDELPVVSRAGRVVGLLDVQDLLKQGFIL
jgi:arabinose-5-phosphate isomerase